MESLSPSFRLPTRIGANGRMTDVERLPDPMPMFVRSTEEHSAQPNKAHDEKAMGYRCPGIRKPAPISDKQTEMFRFVVSAGGSGLEITGSLPEDKSQQNRYRVIGGILKGAEGILVKIKSRRRSIVKVGNITAVAAASYIPDKYYYTGLLLKSVLAIPNRPVNIISPYYVQSVVS